MANIGEIRSKIVLNTREFEASIQKVKQQTKQTNVEVQDLRNAFLGLSAAMGGVIALSVKTAATFESSMTRLKAVSGATASEFEKLKNTAAELGATTSFSASQAADGKHTCRL